MKRYYEIAGIPVQVRGENRWMYQHDGLLAPFRTAEREAVLDVEVRVVDKMIAPRGDCVFSDPSLRVYRDGDEQLRYVGAAGADPEQAHLCILRRKTHSEAYFLREKLCRNVTPKLVLDAMEAEHLIVSHGGILLHGAYIRHGEGAIIFTAPSGVGKSTQAELWCRLRSAQLINGDRAAVVPCPETVQARGVPFSGSSGVSKNVTLPLAAIVYLTQSPRNEIRELRGLEAFRRVWEGCSVNVWNREDMDCCSRTVMEVVQRVPVFHLACTPDEAAVETLETVLVQRR